MPRQRVPKEHTDLMLNLKRTLTTDNFKDMKEAVRTDDVGGFKDAELERIKDVREMLRELEVRGVIGVGKYRKLKEIMRSIGNVAVIGDIDQTEKLLYEKGYGIASGAANTEMTSKRVSGPHQPLDNSSVTECMSIQDYSDDGLRELFYYLKHVKDDDRKKGRENAQLGKVKSWSFSRCNLESFGEDLRDVMSGMTNLSKFELDFCEVTPASMEYMTSSFVSTPKLTELTIKPGKFSKDIGGAVSSWGYNLQSLNLLKSLTLIGCDFQHKDIIYIAASLGMLKNLVNCKLQHNKKVFDFLKQVEEYGKQMTILSLCEDSISSSDLSEILSGIKTREDCFSIDLSGNPQLGGSADLWAQYLKYLKHLRRLFLQECELQSKDIEPLAGSLSDMSTLATLDLSGNPSLGGNAASWAAHLHVGQLNPLKKMSLCNCSLTGVDIEPIAKSVGNIDTLDLSYNKELRHSVASWAPSLRHLKHPTNRIYVNLIKCNFTSEDETLFRKVQQEMSNTMVVQIILENK